MITGTIKVQWITEGVKDGDRMTPAHFDRVEMLFQDIFADLSMPEDGWIGTLVVQYKKAVKK